MEKEICRVYNRTCMIEQKHILKWLNQQEIVFGPWKWMSWFCCEKPSACEVHWREPPPVLKSKQFCHQDGLEADSEMFEYLTVVRNIALTRHIFVASDWNSRVFTDDYTSNELLLFCFIRAVNLYFPLTFIFSKPATKYGFKSLHRHVIRLLC